MKFYFKTFCILSLQQTESNMSAEEVRSKFKSKAKVEKMDLDSDDDCKSILGGFSRGGMLTTVFFVYSATAAEEDDDEEDEDTENSDSDDENNEQDIADDDALNDDGFGLKSLIDEDAHKQSQVMTAISSFAPRSIPVCVYVVPDNHFVWFHISHCMTRYHLKYAIGHRTNSIHHSDIQRRNP